MRQATRNRPPLWHRAENTVFKIARLIGQGALLIALAALAYLWVLVLDGLLNAQEPELREFSTAWGETYERTQRDWGDD